MNTGFTPLVDKSGFYYCPAKPDLFKHENELPNKPFGRMQFLWVVKKFIFNAKPLPASLAQLKFVMRLALGTVKHGRYLLLARSPSTKKQDNV